MEELSITKIKAKNNHIIEISRHILGLKS